MFKKSKNDFVTSSDCSKIKSAKSGDRFIVFFGLDSKEGIIEEIEEVGGILIWKVKYDNMDNFNGPTKKLLPFGCGNTIVFPKKVTTQNSLSKIFFNS